MSEPVLHRVGGIAVREWAAAGPVTLLLPPLGRTGADLAPLAERLARRGLACLVPDPPDPFGARAALADFAADARAVLDTLVPGRRAHLVGATFGGRVARALAAETPERIDRVAVLGPGGIVPPAPEDAAATRRFLEALVRRRPGDILADDALAAGGVYLASGHDPTRPPWRAHLSEGWRLDALAGQRQAARASHADAAWLAAGGRPLLAVHGEGDRLAPAENLPGLSAQPGIDLRVVRLPGAGHWMALEAPDAVAAVVAAFLLTPEDAPPGAPA